MKSLKRFIWLIPAAVVVLLDQLTKQFAVKALKPIDTFPLIPDVLHLTYLENKGAAFGMLQTHRWVFMLTSSVAILAIALLMILCYKKFYHPLLYTALSMIVGGGIGNMIDRIALGYVVDFIDFRLINFAVFNTADSFVCVGAALVILFMILREVKNTRQSKKSSEVSEK